MDTVYCIQTENIKSIQFHNVCLFTHMVKLRAETSISSVCDKVFLTFIDMFDHLNIGVVGRLVNHTRTELIPEASSPPFI